MPDGRVLHVLTSHPVAPTRNGTARKHDRRNHDEIRFWVDYLEDAAYIEDNSGWGGGLARGASVVLVGLLNADPEEDNIFWGGCARSACPRPRSGSSSDGIGDRAGGVPDPQADRDGSLGRSCGLRAAVGGALRRFERGGSRGTIRLPVREAIPFPAEGSLTSGENPRGC